MTSATCQARPPATLEVFDGRRVYRSQHFVVAVNDSGSDILYNLEAILFDSLGHSAAASARDIVSPGSGSQSSSSALSVELDALLFSSGTEVDFTCETHVTGGFSAVAQETQRVIIE